MKVQILKEFYTKDYPLFREGDVVELPTPLAKQFMERELVNVADKPNKKPHSKSEEKRLDVIKSAKK